MLIGDVMDTFEGIVSEIIFSNSDNGYAICDFVSGDENFVITGTMPFVSAGDKLRVSGSWVNHIEYGEQLNVKYFEKLVPESSEEIFLYLASGAISGVKEATAKRIVDHFGDDSLNIIRDCPEKLAKIKGISEQKAISIHNQYIRQIDIQQIISFFGQYGINATLAFKVYKQFGSSSVDRIKANPYCVCEISGIGFKTADRIAYSMGFAENSPERTSAAIIHALSEAVLHGHTYLPYQMLVSSVFEITASDKELISQQISFLTVQNKINRYTLPDSTEVYYLPAFLAAEKGCAEILTELANSPAKKIPFTNEDIVGDITLADKQIDGVRAALENSLVVITGGPGTGKTTLLNTIISIMKKTGLDIALCAPTGRAAKRMSQLCNIEAKTIHRLLEMGYSEDDSKMVFGKNEYNPIEADVVILDEMSMVDILLMYHLLKALPKKCRLVLVGDSDQLPSVGAGNVLKDILSCEKIKSIRLTEIFRQSDQSMIVQNAHNINAGVYPVYNGPDTDFFFLGRQNPADAATEIVRLCSKRLPAYLNGSPLDCVQVICPSRKGNLGTENLNSLLQKELNPPSKDKKELKRSGFVLREGDKIMQIRNNYDMDWYTENGYTGSGIFNGDMGTVEQINVRSGIVRILFDKEKIVEYPFDQLEDLELSYAITVHKSQGSEFTAVVIPMHQCHKNLMSRNLFYTAVTRAKKLVALVGREDVVQFMTDNNYEDLRYSALGIRLSEGQNI